MKVSEGGPKMKVSALYQPEVVTAGPHEALADVASRMQYHEISSVAVVRGDMLLGILTERDVCRAAADDLDLSTVTVERYMTEDPTTVTPDTDAEQAAATMLEMGVRHLPVTEGHRIVGMISARDLLSLEAWNAVGVR